MTMTTPTRFATTDYSSTDGAPPFLRITLTPQFVPADVNLLFLSRKGWSPGDRLRIALKPPTLPEGHPLAAMMAAVKPHVLLRRYDRDEDAFVALTFELDGAIVVDTNDRDFAWRYIRGLLLECPPSFHTDDELPAAEAWISDASERARFLGMLQGALGWDSSHQIPPAIQESIEEAENALAISNYRSCVTMCRRMTEATLKFAHERLLKAKPVDKKGKDLMLNDLIERFKAAPGHPIPQHLLHVADSLRVIGNVPGAHAKDIENYQFSRTDAEFAAASAHYFVDQYFSKVDPEVTKRYTLTIDLKGK